MITLYGIKTCGSVKKAIVLLEKHALPFNFIDLKQVVPSPKDIETWIAKKGINIVLNTKGTTFKKLKNEGFDFSKILESSADSKSAIVAQVKLLQDYPLLLKRPIIISDKTLIIGYDESAILSLIQQFQNKKL